MKKIGNILTEKKFDDKGLYNVVSRKEDLIDGIPTLVIGWEFTKKNYPDVDILNWKICDNVYWTFGNREKRQVYDSSLSKFMTVAINNFINSIIYVPFSVITENETDKKDLFLKIGDENFVKKIYVKNDMVYVYFPFYGKVYGLSLRDINYIGKDSSKFLSKLYSSPNTEIINIKTSDVNTANIVSNFKNCLYVIPCMFYNND